MERLMMVPPVVGEPSQTGAAVASIVSATVVVVVLLTMHRHHGDRFLRWWGIAWIGWICTYLAPAILGELAPTALWILPIVYARESCVVVGIQDFVGRPVARWWFGLAILDALVLYVAPIRDALPFAWLPIHFAIVALPSLIAGWHLLVDERGWEAQLAAAGFILNALTILSITIAMSNNAVATVMWPVAELADLLLAFGVAIALYRRRYEERTAAMARTSAAMEYVIGGFVPICSYCHSLRDKDGAWASIDTAVAAGTPATVSRERCPSCAASSTAKRGPIMRR